MPPKKSIKKCIDCDNSGKFNKALENIICDVCKNTDKYTLITKTKSKSVYILTDDELINLKSFTQNTSYCLATYYTKKDLTILACEKYNTNPENLISVLNDIKNSKEEKRKVNRIKREEKAKEQHEKIKIKLKNLLNENGLILRSDSVLCQKYIGNVTDYSVEEVVERMCQMKYLYDYCHMEECRDIAYDKYNEDLEAGYFPDCTVSEHAEYIALNKYSNGKYPITYPWLS